MERTPLFSFLLFFFFLNMTLKLRNKLIARDVKFKLAILNPDLSQSLALEKVSLQIISQP